MDQISIKVVSIGHLPADLNLNKLIKWQSSIFKIGNIENYSLRCDSDGHNWEFSDYLVREQLPQTFNENFLIAVVNVPIEQNWYSRRLGNNKIVFTFHEISDILRCSNIPLENALFRVFYAYSLLYKRAANRIPDLGGVPSFTHDETRHCLFDMNGIKTDLVYSCHSPIICNECQERLRNERVSDTLIAKTQNEIIKIRKNLYYVLLENIKKHPILTIILSGGFALTIGIIGPLIASFLFEYLKK
jgi:hypothetical protein